MVMMTIARGAAQLYTKGRPVSGLLPGFTYMGSGFFLGVPIPIYLLLAVVLITYFMLNMTRTGRWIYAVGGKGKVFNVVIGALIIGTITNGLDILNVSSYWQQIVKGFIILLAVLIDRKAAR